MKECKSYGFGATCGWDFIINLLFLQFCFSFLIFPGVRSQFVVVILSQCCSRSKCAGILSIGCVVKPSQQTFSPHVPLVNAAVSLFSHFLAGFQYFLLCFACWALKFRLLSALTGFKRGPGALNASCVCPLVCVFNVVKLQTNMLNHFLCSSVSFRCIENSDLFWLLHVKRLKMIFE